MDHEAINKCIGILNEKPKWFSGKATLAEKLQCFDSLQKIGTPSVIYSLVGFLQSRNKLIQEKAVATILHLFSKLKSQNDYTDSLKHLPVTEREIDIYRADFDTKIYLQLLAMASLNGNGYVREKAVKEMARVKLPDSLKFILLRLGDWVAPVREAATAAIPSYLNKVYIDELLQQFSIIDQLLDVKRTDLSGIYQRIIEFILTQEFSNDLYSKVRKLDDKTRLHYFKTLFKYSNPGKEQVSLVFKDKSFLVRLEVLKQLPSFEVAFQKELIAFSLQDQSARIRINALYATKPFAAHFDHQIKDLLSDRSSSVRELCRYLLRSKGYDFAEIYRERIKLGHFLAGSLTGLSEVGSDKDIPLFEKYIHANKNAMVIGCLAAIHQFDPHKAKYYSLTLLTHPVKSVRNKAADVAAKDCDTNMLHETRRIYSVSDGEIKKTILQLYGKIGGWNVIGDFLLALTDEDSSIQNIGWELLNKWKINATRLFTMPSKDAIERANNMYKSIDTSKMKLTDSQTTLLRDIQFYIK